LVLFDVAPLVPAAQPVALQAVEVYYRHLSPWLIGILAHGSAFKGGFIPGCSDIDLKLYLYKEAFVEENSLPLSLAFALHRDIAPIDPAPFQYIQVYAASSTSLQQNENMSLGPVAGAYHMLWGELPIAEATREQSVRSAHRTLQRVPGIINRMGHELLQHGGGKLERHVRFLCTDIWPTLYSMYVLQDNDPLEVWSKPKTVVLERLPANEPIGQAIRNFYHSVCIYYGGELTVDNALRIIEYGVHFLSLTVKWYQTFQEADR
jgi:hypothetical protein